MATFKVTLSRWRRPAQCRRVQLSSLIQNGVRNVFNFFHHLLFLINVEKSD